MTIVKKYLSNPSKNIILQTKLNYGKVDSILARKYVHQERTGISKKCLWRKLTRMDTSHAFPKFECLYGVSSKGERLFMKQLSLPANAQPTMTLQHAGPSAHGVPPAFIFPPRNGSAVTVALCLPPRLFSTFLFFFFADVPQHKYLTKATDLQAAQIFTAARASQKWQFFFISPRRFYPCRYAFPDFFFNDRLRGDEANCKLSPDESELEALE